MEHKYRRFCLIISTALLMLLLLPALPASADGVVEIAPGFMLGRWLRDPVIVTVLLIIAITGISVELLTAGSFGVFGAAGVLALLLYFSGSYFSGSLSLVALALLAAGVLLVAAELFVFPGFGVSGVLGIVAFIAALIVASPSPAFAVWSVIAACAFSLLLLWLLLRNRQTRGVVGKLVLFHRQEADGGYNSAAAELQSLLGKSGMALTTLRPSGTAEIDGQRVDVVSEDAYIASGAPIRVIKVEGFRVVVAADVQP